MQSCMDSLIKLHASFTWAALIFVMRCSLSSLAQASCSLEVNFWLSFVYPFLFQALLSRSLQRFTFTKKVRFLSLALLPHSHWSFNQGSVEYRKSNKSDSIMHKTFSLSVNIWVKVTDVFENVFVYKVQANNTSTFILSFGHQVNLMSCPKQRVLDKGKVHFNFINFVYYKKLLCDRLIRFDKIVFGHPCECLVTNLFLRTT